jgi:hypothetical protein
MKTTTKNTGIKVNTGVKATGLPPCIPNHTRTALKVKAGLKAGSLIRFSNHNARVIAVA